MSGNEKTPVKRYVWKKIGPKDKNMLKSEIRDPKPIRSSGF
jgi:hypothetical protein